MILLRTRTVANAFRIRNFTSCKQMLNDFSVNTCNTPNIGLNLRNFISILKREKYPNIFPICEVNNSCRIYRLISILSLHCLDFPSLLCICPAVSLSFLVWLPAHRMAVVVVPALFGFPLLFPIWLPAMAIVVPAVLLVVSAAALISAALLALYVGLAQHSLASIGRRQRSLLSPRIL